MKESESEVLKIEESELFRIDPTALEEREIKSSTGRSLSHSITNYRVTMAAFRHST
jgi:hypothetical protein